MDSTFDPLWYAVWTRSHAEQLVSDQLSTFGFGVFLPRTYAWVSRGRARRRVEQPLFPGYVFVEHAMDRASHARILQTRGVVRVLGESWDRLATIPREEVDAIRRLVDSGRPLVGRLHLAEGDRVRIIAGPLSGLEGRFLRARCKRGLFLVSVTLLRRSVAVEVDESFVEAA